MTNLTGAQIKALIGPLNPNRVANRKQGNSTLSYLEAWDVRATLIRVFGFGNWSAEVTQSDIVRIAQDVPAWAYNANKDAPKVQKKNPDGSLQFNWQVVAQSTVRLQIHTTGAVYTETGIASQIGPDPGEVADFAIKTASSDALKRAAMNLGTQFGLSLYDNGSTSDVVRVILDPEQAELLSKARTQNGGATQAPVPPQQQDQATELEIDPEAHAAAGASVKAAFGG
jgi:recombination DNA repair RAD52 pathway protein